jgi:hypothetical protein
MAQDTQQMKNSGRGRGTAAVCDYFRLAFDLFLLSGVYITSTCKLG